MEGTVSVQVEYRGRFRNMTGLNSETVTVPNLLCKAYPEICAYAKEKYGIVPPYMVMVNNVHVAGLLKTDERRVLVEHDVFILLPFISGG